MPDGHISGGPGVEAILAPFRGIEPSLMLVIEDADGRRVAGTSSDDVPVTVIAREIAAGPLAGGRVVAWGSALDTQLAHATVASMAVALGIAHTVRAAGIADVADARRIEQELALGRELQRNFVGLVGPEIPGYDLACHYEQAYEVGGDFFDVFRLVRRGRPLSVVVADVTGKGIAAALLMAFARPLIHAAIDNIAFAHTMAVPAQRIAIYIGGYFIDVVFDVSNKPSQPAFGRHVRGAVCRGYILEDRRLNGGIRQVVGLHLYDDIAT